MILYIVYLYQYGQYVENHELHIVVLNPCLSKAVKLELDVLPCLDADRGFMWLHPEKVARAQKPELRPIFDEFS